MIAVIHVILLLLNLQVVLVIAVIIGIFYYSVTIAAYYAGTKG